MKVQYDKEVNAVYLRLKDSELAASEVARSEEVEPGIIFDFDESDGLIGVEILSIQHRPKERIELVNNVLTEQQREEFSNFYKQMPV